MIVQRFLSKLLAVSQFACLVLAALMPSPGYAQTPARLVHETCLGEYRPKARGGFSHAWVAYVEEEGERRYVRLNGSRLGPYDRISDLFRFTDDGTHIAFAAKRDDTWHVVVDGKERWAHKDLWWGRYTWTPDLVGNSIQMQTGAAAFYFTPDTARVVYAARDADGKWVVHVDGEASKAFRAVGFTSAFFHNDQVCYPAWTTKGDSHVFVIGKDEELGPFDATWRASVSADQQHYCFQAKREGKPVLVFDGNVIDRNFDDIGGYAIDAVGQLAYSYKQGSKWKVDFGGHAIGDQYDEVYYRFLEISPDGKNVAFWAKEGDKWYVVTKTEHLSGFAGMFFHQVNEKKFGIFWGPDSKHVAYITRTSDGTKLALDGQIRCDVPSLYGSDLQAVVAWLVANPTAKSVPKSIRSVDGELAYIKKDQESDPAEVIVGSKVHGPYDTVDALHISPNKKHYAYAAMADGKESLVIDGVPVGTFDKIHRLSFIDNRTVALLGVRAEEIFGIRYGVSGLQ